MKMIRHPVLAIASTIWLLLFGASSHAETDTRARNLAASCAACHGTNGHSAGGAPVLAATDRALFIQQMKDFKSGARTSTVMQRHAKGYSDEELEKLADFFAAQKR